MHTHSLDATKESADSYLFGRGQAWFAFAMTLGADDVRLRRPPGHRLAFPAHEGRLGPVGQAARCAGLGGVGHGRARGAAGGAVRRPRQPGQEHRRDGHRLEPGDDLVHVHAQLRPVAGRARVGRPGRGRLRLGRCGADRQPFPVAHARRADGGLLRFGLGRLGARRDARRLDRGALGLEGRVRRGRLSRPGAGAAVPEGARLPDRGARRRGRTGPRARRAAPRRPSSRRWSARAPCCGCAWAARRS